NFSAWSPEMVPDPDTSCVGMEYFCDEGDELWSMGAEELRALASKELAHLGLCTEEKVFDAAVIRQPKAYPVYDSEYADALEVIKTYLLGFANFQTVGRNGLHRYNNQDHSMLSAMYAARNLMGGDYDVWDVNVDQVYHETDDSKPKVKKGHSERLQPQRNSSKETV
ncbi:MAG: FAD-dependent oxidoreductase, partial [Mangrovicoccus sp.]